MPYSTPPDVRLIIDTTLTDTQITTIIEMSDTQIDTRIGPQTTPDELIKKLSTLLTAHTIKTRQPQTLTVGEYKEDTGDTLKAWEQEITRIYKLHENVSIKTSDYAHINDDERYPRGL